MLLARLVRSIVRDRVMPTVDAPLPLRQSIDAGLNYAGVIIAILVGIGALGIDFTNLAIVLGALSVGIGLGLQNIANNVISGVILLIERPIKAGDWVSVERPRGLRAAHQHPRHRDRDLPAHARHRAQQHVPAEPGHQPHLFRHVEPRRDPAHGAAVGTDVAKLEAILREAALGHPRVLRVPPPIVRFVRIGADGLDFELFVFVAQLEDRLIVDQRPQPHDPRPADRGEDHRSRAGAGIQAARHRQAGAALRGAMPAAERRQPDTHRRTGDAAAPPRD